MSRLPETGPSLSRWLRQQQRLADRQANSSPFARSGTRVVAEGVTQVDGTLRVVGDLDVSGTAAFDGATTIGGNAAITGTLSLPSGIIDNDALTSPVKPQVVYFSATHTLTTTTTTVATSGFTVPAGFTKALVSVSVRARGTNNNTTGGADGAGSDYLGQHVAVGTADGYANFYVKGGNGMGECVALASALLTGLTSGGTITIPVTAQTDYFTWASGVYTEVSGTILWLR